MPKGKPAQLTRPQRALLTQFNKKTRGCSPITWSGIRGPMLLWAAKAEAERTADCAPIDAVVKRFRRARSSIAAKHARAGLKDGGAAWQF
jgi:hypothetical protein